MAAAVTKARQNFGSVVTFSPKVFIPLTQLCRDVCHYCSFSRPPRANQRAFLSPDQVRTIAANGKSAGCGEALFTLGEQPETRYRAARDELDMLGYRSTNAYCAAMADMVGREFGLIPHINAGVMNAADIVAFRRVSGSQGMMLESVSPRLCERGQPHFGSPGKAPERRIAMIEAAGELSVPYTTGILIGIGETREERIASLLAIRDLHRRYGHIQEVIVQNFRPKPGTKMAGVPAPSFEDLQWSAAVARLILPGEISLQVPPNLSFDDFGGLLDAGINDWGGISPVTPDHVSPEAAWPAVDDLRREAACRGLDLAARSPLYPRFFAHIDRWVDPGMTTAVMRASDAEGLLRQDAWSPGDASTALPPVAPSVIRSSRAIDLALAACQRGDRLDPAAVVALLSARGGGVEAVGAAADIARVAQAGSAITYVVNRNINYTNICSYKCGFCAFSKGRTHDHLRGRPYDISLEEIARRTLEASQRGATEVCMQGGIHPRFTGNDYLDILAAAKEAVPAMHVHAFSPLEVHHGATTLGIDETRFLEMLRDAGLGSLPGTSAEILSDNVRARICPDKLDSAGWLRVIGKAHRVGLPTTSTIMFGHVESLHDIAMHLLAIRDLQTETGGITEFVPLPFVHAEAPMSLKGLTRRGPTFRETFLLHAVARLVLGPLIPNIQASWTKLGIMGVKRCLSAGVNDLGGVLMNESISRAAGAGHGEELSPTRMEELAEAVGRPVRQRTTLYGPVDPVQRMRSYQAAALAPLVLGKSAKRASGVLA